MFNLAQHTNKIKISKHGIVNKKNDHVIIIFKVPTTSAKFSIKPKSSCFTLEAQVIKGYPCVMNCTGLFEDGSILIQKNLLKLSLNIPQKLMGTSLNFHIYPQGAGTGRTELHINNLCFTEPGQGSSNEFVKEEKNRLIENFNKLQSLEQEEVAQLVKPSQADFTNDIMKVPLTKEEIVSSTKEEIRKPSVKEEIRESSTKEEIGESSTKEEMGEDESGPELSARVKIERLGVNDILRRLKKLEKKSSE